MKEEYYVIETKTPGYHQWVRRDNRFPTVEKLRDSDHLRRIKNAYVQWRIVKVTVEVIENAT